MSTTEIDERALFTLTQTFLLPKLLKLHQHYPLVGLLVRLP